MSVVAQADWETMAVDLFGDNKEDWRFSCPRCGHELSISEARELFPDVEGRGWRFESECIGRYTSKAGCDWAAYGLFRGPVFVVPTEHHDKQVPVFDFAGLPFTGAGGGKAP